MEIAPLYATDPTSLIGIAVGAVVVVIAAAFVFRRR